MLKCYPIAAVAENWLHDTLVDLIEKVHSGLDAGTDIKNSQEVWEKLLPASLTLDQMESLKSSYGMRNHVFAYKDSVASLTVKDREKIYSVLQVQNEIPQLLCGSVKAALLSDDYPEVHEAAKGLFVFCYEKLTELKVRERQYEIIFNSLETKICPFCGIERVMHPTETAQDQDHYLPKSIYPFAAANLLNLVPMCRCCNRDYKKTKNVLFDEKGNGRTAFYPYNCIPTEISLMKSSIDGMVSPPLPSWDIDFIPNVIEVETWDSVFEIRTRYKRDVLDEYFGRWFGWFVSKCAKDRVRKIIKPNLSEKRVRVVFANYVEDRRDSPPVGMANFLESKVLEFLLSQYDKGNVRVVGLIRDAVLGTVP